MKKRILISFIILIVCIFNASNCFAFYDFSNINLLKATDTEVLNAFDLVKKMNVGFNLGNSLDAMLKDRGFCFDSETFWSNPKVTKQQIDKVKQLGFNSIRIPVSFYNHLDSNGIIDVNWLDRIKTIVDYAYDNNLYIIINVHHDAGMDTKYNWIYSDVNTYSEDLANIKNLWRQIAPYFRDYDNKLLFEFHNEIMNRDSNWDWNTQADDFRKVHDMDQELINLIRATGGNNANRFLIVSTWGASSDSKQIECLMYKEFEDTIPNHLIMEVHNYYTGESKVKELCERLKNSSDLYNMPIIIGESGTETGLDNNLRLETAEAFSKYSKENNLGLFWWDNGSSFDLFNRQTLETTHQDIVDALLKYYKIGETDNDDTKEELFKNSAFSIDYEKKLITNIPNKLLLNSFMTQLTNASTCKVEKKDATFLSETEYIGTGMKLVLEDNNEYILVVKGDVTGDGLVTGTDLLKTKKHIVGLNELKVPYIYGADVNLNNQINGTDILNIKRIIIGIIK